MNEQEIRTRLEQNQTDINKLLEEKLRLESSLKQPDKVPQVRLFTFVGGNRVVLTLTPEDVDVITRNKNPNGNTTVIAYERDPLCVSDEEYIKQYTFVENITQFLV